MTIHDNMKYRWTYDDDATGTKRPRKRGPKAAGKRQDQEAVDGDGQSASAHAAAAGAGPGVARVHAPAAAVNARPANRPAAAVGHAREREEEDVFYDGRWYPK